MSWAGRIGMERREGNTSSMRHVKPAGGRPDIDVHCLQVYTGYGKVSRFSCRKRKKDGKRISHRDNEDTRDNYHAFSHTWIILVIEVYMNGC